MSSQIQSQASCASTALSSQQAETGYSQLPKVKLRLCYGGRFEQTPSNTYKFVGGEYFNESIPYGIRYADFMFKLSEKFKTAVSVKYHAPGEELVPDQLISVQDDADLQELVEDYLAHLQLPGTPRKTFRIKVFVFMAAEEPLTPDEIMEGQHFFSECQLGMPARLNAVRLLDGRSSFGSTLSSVGTPSTRQQDLSVGDWPKDSAGQALDLGLDELEAGELFDEQEVLERMRAAVSCNPPQRLRQQQRRLSTFAGLSPDTGAARAALEQQLGEAGFVAGVGAAGDAAADAAAALYDDSAYEEELGGNMLRRQISREMDEVLEAIDAQQQQDAAAAVATIAEVQQAAVLDVLREAAVAAGHGCADEDECLLSDYQSEAHTSHTPYTDGWDRQDDDGQDEDAAGQQLAGAGQQRDQQRDLHQQRDWGHADSVDSLVRALPTHISDFGESPPDEEEAAANTGAQANGVAAGAATDGPAVPPDGTEGAATHHLPSHISAFGDDLGPLPGGRAMLSASEDADDGFAADLAPRLSGQLGYARPRTQDSSFSLDGGAFEGDATTPGGAGGINAERAGSGDSLASLPKLQPVHRLAKPDLKIVQRIGEGAFGEVSVAKAPLYGTVAVKWLKSERFTKHFASFGREAALLADLNHPNVLRFYGVVTESTADNTVIGIMTEYIRGGSMSSFLRMSRTLLPLRVRCELALGAANGLAYLHELRIVHFDLKPDNLLLDAPLAVVRAAAGSGTEELPSHRAASPRALVASGGDSSSRGGPLPGSTASSQDQLLRGGSGAAGAAATTITTPSPNAGRSSSHRNSSGPGAGTGSGLVELSELPVVKVADFGLSKHKLNSSYVSSCRDLRGTLPYMAPELVSDPERVCEKADVWSLGVVMWEMLTRETPFQDLPPQGILLGLMCGNLHLDIPEWCEPEWRYLLEACMEANPNNRPTMRELARQLEAIRDQQLQQELEELEAQRQQQQQQQVRQREQQQQQQAQLQEVRQREQQQQQASPQQQVAAVEPAPASVGLQQQQQQLFQHYANQQQPPVLLQEPLPHQQQQLLPQQVLNSPADASHAAAAFGVYGAVCEHYWPQQSPRTPAAALAAVGPHAVQPQFQL